MIINKRIICSKTRAYKADVVFNGKKHLDKTFFPSDWTYEQTIEKTLEACQNVVKKPEVLLNGRWKLTGVSNEGFKVGMILEETKEAFTIITSYPI